VLKRFDHVAVAVRDLDGARRFFALPGFREERAVVIAGAPFDRCTGVTVELAEWRRDGAGGAAG
jgi:catechol 2,3-dioxygenase-like lactoylglutathione lyase family enzyme